MSRSSFDHAGRATTSIVALITSLAVLVAVLATTTDAFARVPTLHLSAADAQLSGSFRSVEDARAPGGSFVHVDHELRNTRVFDAENGAFFCFTVPEPGAYTLSADVMGPDNEADSFFVRLDSLDPWVWEFSKSEEFATQSVTDQDGDEVEISLEAGQHVVGFYLRESGARLAGVSIYGEVGVSPPQPCDGPDFAVSDSQQQSTTTSEELATSTTGGTVSSTSKGSEPSTSGGSSSSTSEKSATSTSDGSATSTSESSATTSTTVKATTTTKSETTTTVGGQFDVVISPSDDVNGILQSHPNGTSFLLKAGTYRRLTLEPKSGQSITGENGTVLDGEGRTDHALGDETTANGITLRNLKIINYTEFGVAWGGQGGGKDWTIVSCEIAHNHAGVALKDGAVVRNSQIHNNTTHGVWGNGRVVLEGNEIAYNHSQSHSSRANGGILLGRSTGSVVRNNHIHHNYSFGLHFDGHNENALIEGNLVEDNDEAGILYELGYSATIRNNVSRRNGGSGKGGDGAGIMVIGATDVTVRGNRVENNVNGIVGRQPNRTKSDGSLWALKNLRVVDNIVKMSQGWTGIYDRASGEPSLDANNVFEGNSYSTSGENFRWGSDRMALSEWQEIHPNDG